MINCKEKYDTWMPRYFHRNESLPNHQPTAESWINDCQTAMQAAVRCQLPTQGADRSPYVATRLMAQSHANLESQPTNHRFTGSTPALRTTNVGDSSGYIAMPCTTCSPRWDSSKFCFARGCAHGRAFRPDIAVGRGKYGPCQSNCALLTTYSVVRHGYPVS